MTAENVMIGTAPAKAKVGFLLGVGILLLPIVFVWWLLKPGYSLLARVVGFGWLGLIVLAILGSSGGGSSNPQSAKTPAVTSSGSETATTVSEPVAPAASKSKWTYSESVDEMRGTKTRLATLESTNELKFGFPYDGGTTQLMLRQRPQDGLNVILEVKGQFVCNSFSDDKITAKFDDGPIQSFGCAEPSSGGTGTLFVKSEKRFLESLKKAKTLTIEAEFYEAGPRQISFDVAGLNWE